MPSNLSKSVLSATLLASTLVLWSNVTPAAVVYDQTLTTSPAAVVNTDVGSFTNCLASEGCLGTGGNVTPSGTNLPDTIPFSFSLSAAQIAAVTAGPGAVGTLTVIASRDIGHKTGAAADDFIGVTGDGVALGNLFQNTIDSCPAGERGAAYAADLVCGPNFHTDVKGTDALTIGTANITSFAADGIIQFVLNPTDTVGRLKLFAVELQITTIPEPSTFAVLALGIVALGVAARRKI